MNRQVVTRVDRAGLQSKVDMRFAQLKAMNDSGVLGEFETALKTRIAAEGFAWGKDPNSKIRTAADYVRDVVKGQGRELADSVRQVIRRPAEMELFFDDIAARGFSAQAVGELDAWLKAGPVLIEFQKRVTARPRVFAALAGIR